jgi:hypothetical protein
VILGALKEPGVLLGSKGVQEESSWDFLVLKVHYEGLKVYDAAMCVVLRLRCYNVHFFML